MAKFDVETSADQKGAFSVKTMRKDRLYALGTLAFCIWMSMTYFLFVHRPNAEAVRRRLGFDGKSSATLTLTALSHRVDEFEKRLKQTSDENSQLLQVLREAVKESQKQEKHKNNVEVPAKEPNAAPPVAWSLQANVVIPVLMFACNRVTVAKALDSLLQIRKDKHKFPIIVSQVQFFKIYFTKLFLMILNCF